MQRNVSINGKVYTDHNLTAYECVIGEHVVARVESTYDGLEEPLLTFHALPWQDGLTVSQCESQTWALPEFDEYVDDNELLDEVLAILTDEQAVEVPNAFRSWRPDTTYSIGDRVRWNGSLYKCLQAHTSVESQSPDVAVSLWAAITEPGTIPVWVQPDSTNPYMKGDKVHYPDASGPIYESTIDNNVFAPDVYPQGWKLVEGGE